MIATTVQIIANVIKKKKKGLVPYQPESEAQLDKLTNMYIH